MYFFVSGLNYAAVENATKAAQKEADGWTRCTCAEFVAAWKRRDLARLADLPPIGAVASKAGAVLERLPNGYARFQV